MANHKSAVKRNLQNQNRRLRNRTVKTRVKGVAKKVSLLDKSTDAAAVSQELTAAQSVIDTAAKKGVLHHRTASRKISRLAKQVNCLSAS